MILGLKKMTQLLRALVALPEDLSSVPCIHIRPTACMRTHVRAHTHRCMHTQTCTCVHMCTT